MKFNKDTNILIIGLGVIGGGYATALTKQGYTVNCITKSQSTVDYAIEHGMVSKATTNLDEDLIKQEGLYKTIWEIQNYFNDDPEKEVE